MLISYWASQNCSEIVMRTTSHSQCFYRKGKRALEHKQLDSNLTQHAFPMGDFTNKMSWASYTNLGAKIGGETSALPRADDVCPYVPSTILLPLSHRSFFSFQLEKCFQFLNHFFINFHPQFSTKFSHCSR